MTAPVEITLLTQTSCALCDLAKGILARVGERVSVVGDRGRSAQRRGPAPGRRAGVLFAPGVLVDGSRSRSAGFPNANFGASWIAAPP